MGVLGGTVVVTSGSGLIGLSAADGAERWRFDELAGGELTVLDTGVLFQGNDGTLALVR